MILWDKSFLSYLKFKIKFSCWWNRVDVGKDASVYITYIKSSIGNNSRAAGGE